MKDLNSIKNGLSHFCNHCYGVHSLTWSLYDVINLQSCIVEVGHDIAAQLLGSETTEMVGLDPEFLVLLVVFSVSVINDYLHVQIL